MGLPATGLRATITGIAITTFAGDLIAVVWDALGMLRQLGAIPAAEPAAAAR